MVLFFRKEQLPCLLASFLLLAGCASGPAEKCRIAFATELPLAYHHGSALTQVTLNGRAVTMVLDTGSQFTTLTKATADRLALNLQPSGEATGIGGSRRSYLFYARSFQVGRLHGTNLPLFVAAMDLSGEGTPVDGLLGSDFLAQYAIDLDFAEHRARLFKAMNRCSSPAAALREPLFIADMVRSSDRYDTRPFVKVEIGGKHLIAAIDTGASGSVIFRDSASRLGLKLDELTRDPHFHARGVGPRAPDAAVHVMAPIAIGEITVGNLPVAIVDQRSPDQADMLLGLDFLVRVHVWLSFSSSTVVMQYPPAPSPSLPADVTTKGVP